MLNCLNDVNEKLLAEIERLGGLFFTPNEIALMLEIDQDFFMQECKNENSILFKKWKGGWLQAEIEIREANKKMAKAGSSQAQTQMLELLKIQIIKLRKDG